MASQYAESLFFIPFNNNDLIIQFVTKLMHMKVVCSELILVIFIKVFSMLK